MSLSFWPIIFIFGACLGSFLNCVIYRLARPNFSLKNLGGLKGRSFCPKCYHKLGFFDLIPILSFIFLKEKCRYCGEKISWQYPLVEIVTGGLFLLIFNSQFSPKESLWFPTGQAIFNLIYYLTVSSLLVIIFVYDLKHYIIPDKIIYPVIGIALGFGILNSYIINHKSFLNPLLAGFGAGAFFFLIWLISQGKWMGLGDAKLIFFMGLFLGFPNILVSLFSAFLIGAIIGIGLMASGKKSLKSQVPFGPFLIIGTFIALFWGREIINWYLSLL